MLDPNYLISDFDKMDNRIFTHCIIQAYHELNDEKDKSTDYSDVTNWEQLLEASKKLAPKDLTESQLTLLKKLTYIFCFTSRIYFPPLAAFLGGLASQEIIKAIT